MAYVYIQHLDPTHSSSLSNIIGRETDMKVQEAKNLLPIKADHVYIIPPNKSLSIIDGVLKVSPRQPKPAIHTPIDKFFVSMAEKQKEASIGIILSGNGSDGTLGLKSIKAAGGITFVQNDSAKFQSMPQSAAAEGYADMVLSPKQIAKELERLSSNIDLFKEALLNADTEDVKDERHLKIIIDLIKQATGVDFAHYKMTTIRRRIVRRMLLYKMDTLPNYARYLKSHPNEVTVLYNDLLINVTTFFRDPDLTEYLKKVILPRLIKRKRPEEAIRIWIPACSTGEEAYTMAITLVELLGEKAIGSIQIFATDLSEIAIAKARIGLYSQVDLIDVSPKRLQRFFSKVENGYRISKQIRDLCVFAPHNVLKDPPFSRMDLISCCNLMIYLDAILQRKIINTFHYALNTNGYLVLGKSETIGSSMLSFSQVERKYKVYVKKETDSKTRFEINYRLSERPSISTLKSKDKQINLGQERDLEKSIDDMLFSKYIPASVVINQDMEIMMFRGSTGLFLEPSPGKASLNLIKMARNGLTFELRSAIHKCMKTAKAVRISGIEIKNKDHITRASIEVTPVRFEVDGKILLVVFEAHEDVLPAAKTSVTKDKIVKQLQQELNRLKSDMRSVMEDQEATVEELQSANEEVVSSNEELQSINEELETSKEEVESTNEELMTINSELQMRNEQLAESYEYAEAVFDTIREAVLVLDKDLRIRTANKAFYKIFNTKEINAEGIFIYELADGQWDVPKLRQLLQDVASNGTTFNGYEIAYIFPSIGEKVMLLNARRVIQKTHQSQLILLAMEDITEHKQAQKILADRELWFRNMADNAPVMIWVGDTINQRNFFNNTWLNFTGNTLEQEIGRGWERGIHPNDQQMFMSLYQKKFDKHETFQIEFRLKRHDGEYRWISDSVKPTYSSDGTFAGYIGSCTEVHDKKMYNQELEKKVRQRTKDLQAINMELQRSNGELQQFAYVASHDLQEPLRKIMTFADRIERFKENLPEAGALYLSKIVDSSQRMTRLIDDLLNLSRLSKTDDKFQKVNLNDVLNNVLVDFELAIQQKKAEVVIENLPIINAIGLQMEQLFHNLLSNAFKFSKEDAPCVIKVSCRYLTSSEVAQSTELSNKLKYVEIKVEDNGIGFSEEFAERIFVIFQRLNEKAVYPGTGIGLAICKKIVSNHGGQISASSTEGEGAVFKIILPAE